MTIIMHNITRNIFGVYGGRVVVAAYAYAAVAALPWQRVRVPATQVSPVVWTLGMFLATPTTLDVHLRDDMTHCR